MKPKQTFSTYKIVNRNFIFQRLKKKNSLFIIINPTVYFECSIELPYSWDHVDVEDTGVQDRLVYFIY